MNLLAERMAECTASRTNRRDLLSRGVKQFKFASGVPLLVLAPILTTQLLR